MSVGAALDLDLAGFEPARSDDQLERQADEVHAREFLARARGGVVIKDFNARRFERGVSLGAGAVGSGLALFQVDKADMEGRDCLRPYDAGVVMAAPVAVLVAAFAGHERALFIT